MKIEWFPQFELLFLRRPEFFPPRPRSFLEVKDICLGTKSRKLGDSLMLTTLPRRLKAKYPHLRSVTVYPRGYNPVVFFNNPYLDRVSYFPEALWGDDCDWGSGQMLQLKEAFFDLEPSTPPRPELYLTAAETHEAKSVLDPLRTARSLVILHPFASPTKTLFTAQFWEATVAQMKAAHPGAFDFVQVGVEGNPKIAGCIYHALYPIQKFRTARKLFAITSLADGFLGMDSGPMHVARAFAIPSLVATPVTNLSEIFEKRVQKVPYYLFHSGDHCFLYDDISYLKDQDLEPARAEQKINEFLVRNVQKT